MCGVEDLKGRTFNVNDFETIVFKMDNGLNLTSSEFKTLNKNSFKVKQVVE